MQPYLSLLWLKLVTYFVSRATCINNINGKTHKMELINSRNYSTYHAKSKSHHNLFMASGAYTYTHAYLHDNDFKKPGKCWPLSGVHLV